MVFWLENCIFGENDKIFREMLTCMWFHFWSRFGSIFLLMLMSILAPESVPKLVQKIEMFRLVCGTLFRILKLFKWVPLESLLASLMLVLRAPKTQKVCFSVLESSWRPARAHLGASWPVLTLKCLPKWIQNGTKNQKKNGPKNMKKWSTVEPHF